MRAELVDYMGGDLTVVNAARVSFAKERDPYDSITNPDYADKDQKLIKYLADHNHFTPFTHCMITMREKVPIFVARQRFKHTVGFSYNEVSRRYVDEEPEFYWPDKWRKRAEDKKQGSIDEEVTVDEGSYKEHPSYYISQLYFEIQRNYKYLLEDGVAPEQARMVLPQNTYTEYYVTGSLAAWARAYNLRSQPDAQQEIRELAEQWNKILTPLYPYSWEALTRK